MRATHNEIHSRAENTPFSKEKNRNTKTEIQKRTMEMFFKILLSSKNTNGNTFVKREKFKYLFKNKKHWILKEKHGYTFFSSKEIKCINVNVNLQKRKLNTF